MANRLSGLQLNKQVFFVSANDLCSQGLIELSKIYQNYFPIATLLADSHTLHEVFSVYVNACVRDVHNIFLTKNKHPLFFFFTRTTFFVVYCETQMIISN